MKTKSSSAHIVLAALFVGLVAPAQLQEDKKSLRRADVQSDDAIEVRHPAASPKPADDTKRARTIVRAADQQTDEGKATHEGIVQPAIEDGDPPLDNPLAAGADFVVGGGTQVVVKNGAKVSVSGNLTNNGTLSYLGGWALCFNGSENQTLSGISAFDTLVVCKSGTLTLGNSSTVSGKLELTSGELSTGSNTITITNATPGAVSIPTDGGSVNGTIIRTVAAGTRGLYQFTNDSTYIFPDGAQGAVTVSVRAYPNTFPPAGNTSAAIKRYYTITPSASFTAEKLSLAFDRWTENPHGVPLLSMVLFRNSSGTLWVNVGGIPSGSNPSVHHSVFLGYVTQWSNWAIADGNQPLPIQLSSFTGRELPGGRVRLDWITSSEVNNLGFFVQRRAATDSIFVELANSFVPGHGTTNEPQHYWYIDSTVTRGHWRYRLKQVDLDGTVHYSEAIAVETVTNIADNQLPTEYGLSQNYPNPFNPTTTIKYQLPANSHVTLKVYNLIGQEVAMLLDGFEEAGYKSVQWHPSTIASGVYIYRLAARSIDGGKGGNFVSTRKLIVLK